MKKALAILISAAIVAALLAACTKKKTESADVRQAQTDKVDAAQTASAQPEAVERSGKVVETMNSGGYTYIQVDTGKEKIWAAAPQFEVAVGDPVVVPAGMPMANFHSATLNRTFEMVYFVPGIGRPGTVAADTMAGAGSQPQMPPGHPPATGKTTVDFSGIVKAQGGMTVSEVITGKDQLAGKEVVLRGKVVKFLSEIMGKNWLHVQDGSGSPGANDLTITVAPGTVAKVGDTVLVKGIVTTDKDFGYGYKYDIIMEDAQVTVE